MDFLIGDGKNITKNFVGPRLATEQELNITLLLLLGENFNFGRFRGMSRAAPKSGEVEGVSRRSSSRARRDK